MITPTRARRAAWAFGFVFLAFGYVLWQSTTLYLLGRERIRTFVPVPVAITEVGVESRPGKRGGTYWAPRIRYGIQTKSGIVMGRQVTPLDEASTKAWAEEIASRFVRGKVDQGYAHPDSVGLSFLVPELGWFWQITLAVGLGLVGVFFWLLRRARAA